MAEAFAIATPHVGASSPSQKRKHKRGAAGRLLKTLMSRGKSSENASGLGPEGDRLRPL